MREKHELLSRYIEGLCEDHELCKAKIGTWSEAHLRTDNKIYQLLNKVSVKSLLNSVGIRCGDIVFAITDNPDSDHGVYFASHRMYINSPTNVDTDVVISYKDIKGIDISEGYNICTISTRDGNQYRLTSDLWDNVSLFGFLQYVLVLCE